jgi:glyoxylase-like metal-dependent hydrolase (beta-lactamase superfamily II)
VHVYDEEYRAAMNPKRYSLKERFYVRTHWQHAPDWVVHSCQGERWFGFDCARVIEGLPFEVLFIPLHGHSRGHCGVAVGGHGEWLLHCGDAYVRDMQVSLDEERNPFPRWANALQQWLFPNEPVSRLRELRRQHGDEISMFCSHDREVFYRLKGR